MAGARKKSLSESTAGPQGRSLPWIDLPPTPCVDVVSMGEVAVTTTEWLFVLNFYVLLMNQALRSVARSRQTFHHPLAVLCEHVEGKRHSRSQVQCGSRSLISVLPSTADIHGNERYVRFARQHRKSADLFNHLVGAGEQCRRHNDSKRLCGLQIDHQFELGRLFNRQVGSLRALEKLVNEVGGPTK
jgi:hypothetical protein